MDLTGFQTNEQAIEERMEADPEFRAEWERTALARAVAIEIIRYRADMLSRSGLSQSGSV